MRPILLSSLLLFACCSAPDVEPGSPDADVDRLAAELAAELDARADAPPLDHAPAVRAARLAVARAQVAAARVGATPLMAEVEHAGNGADHETELMVALDVTALVGGGRQAAARAEALASLHRAEQELARARFVAELDLARLFVRRKRDARLDAALAALEVEAAPSLLRIGLLRDAGRVAPLEAAAADATRAGVAAERQRLAAELLENVSEIELAFGRRGGADFARLADFVESYLPPPRSFDESDGARLLRHHPELHVARAEWLVAEAEVRVAAAQQWPALLIGPKAVLTSDDWLLGGVARLELPWPPAASAAVDAARAARDAARDGLATALAAQQSRIAAARVRSDAAERTLDEHVAPAAQARATQLVAAAARFAADRAALPDWTMAFEQRFAALVAEADAQAETQLAALALQEAVGPRRDGDALARAEERP